MKNKIQDWIFFTLGLILFLPSIFVMALSYMMGAEEGSKTAQLIATVLAVTNSALLWWIIIDWIVK